VKLAGLAAVAIVATVFGASELAVLFGAAAVWWLLGRAYGSVQPAAVVFFQNAVPAAATAAGFGLVPLLLYFLKIGSVLFGSGYVLIAFLRGDLVERLGLLTEQQLLDAVAVGQITPGPLFTTATFIGYVLLGPAGALVATIGIFLPAFVFVAITHPMVRRLRSINGARDFLDGINAAAVALMTVVTWQLGRAAIVDIPTAAVALIAIVVLLATRLNSTWLILGAALTGLVVCSGGL
jgi:chromate transporter